MWSYEERFPAINSAGGSLYRDLRGEVRDGGYGERLQANLGPNHPNQSACEQQRMVEVLTEGWLIDEGERSQISHNFEICKKQTCLIFNTLKLLLKGQGLI